MIIDAHTDVLWKMLKEPKLDFYSNTNSLSVNYPNMLLGNVSVQVFAIYVSTLKNNKFHSALQSIDDFYEKILNHEKLILAKSYNDIVSALNHGKKAALLSLEGADPIGNDISRLRIFYQLGVRAVGLTWNYANDVADGVLEKRNSGLTNFGLEFIKELNRLGMLVDISHLSEKGFWDVLEISSSPIIASHSNAKEICNHPRNLTDHQIKAIIKNEGVIGVTFVRSFTAQKENPTIDDLLLHIDHIAGLGGIKNIALGSDFDGAHTIEGLKDPSQFDHLVNTLNSKYSSEDVKGILSDNWLNIYKKVLNN